jgi:hypothetical protein
MHLSRNCLHSEKFFPRNRPHGYNIEEKQSWLSINRTAQVSGIEGRRCMDKKVLWLIIIFTILFIIGVNTGELGYLMNLGNTI